MSDKIKMPKIKRRALELFAVDSPFKNKIINSKKIYKRNKSKIVKEI